MGDTDNLMVVTDNLMVVTDSLMVVTDSLMVVTDSLMVDTGSLMTDTDSLRVDTESLMVDMILSLNTTKANTMKKPTLIHIVTHLINRIITALLHDGINYVIF